MSKEIDRAIEPKARRCTVLDFEAQAPGVSVRSRRAIITLGGPDGTVDRVELRGNDGLRLLERLAFAFRASLRMPTVGYGTRAWLSRHSILRAQAKLEDDEDRVYEQTRRTLPEVVEFMNEELEAVRRQMSREGVSPKRAQAMVGRLHRAMLTLIDATRGDT